MSASHLNKLNPEARGWAVPPPGSLEGCAALNAASQGVDLQELAPRDEIRLRTANSIYQLIVLDPPAGRVLVRGGESFAEPTTAVRRGSTCGGALLKVGWIGGGLQIELSYQPPVGPAQNLTTSPAEGLYIERAGR